ncbi:MAG: protein kinase domain-containing protein, partial [Aggregatilineaceae bacterium]
MAELIGHTLGQYRLEALIGRGGMASVYRARQESMDRDVAIKVMAAELAHNSEFVARFEREARVIARLQHPHILPVIDFGRHGDRVYLVMQLVEGGVLSDRLRQTPLTLTQVTRFLTQIASALHYAHQRGVVHRDLKPNNVLLDTQDNVYLTDFGIAKMLAGTTTTAQSLTATGSVMGTPAYMAPEQWRSEPVDARTDIYALGVILFEMLVGALPFHADTPFSMMYKHFDTPPPPLHAINPTLPPALDAVVLRALAKDPADRYPSAQQLADDFARAVAALPPDTTQQPLPRATPEQIERATPSAGQRAATPPVPPPPGPPPAGQSWAGPAAAPPAPLAQRRRGRGWLAGAALAAVAVIGAIVVALLALRGDRQKPASLSQQNATQTAIAALAEVPSPTQTVGLIILSPSESPTATPSASFTASPTEGETPSPTFTNTPSPTSTEAAGALVTATPRPDTPPSETPSLTATVVPPTHTATVASPSATPTSTPVPTTVAPSATVTPTSSATSSPSATFTPSFTPSQTPDLSATAAALVALRLTQTAESWTDTPTPDIEASVVAALTGTAAAWTDTPSPTPTVTASHTPSPTPTPTPSHTPTPTLTPS